MKNLLSKLLVYLQRLLQRLETLGEDTVDDVTAEVRKKIARLTAIADRELQRSQDNDELAAQYARAAGANAAKSGKARRLAVKFQQQIDSE